MADAATGKVRWQEWLGDPLMSQPAVAAGRIYIAYPDSRGDGKHRLLCADLRTGRHRWKREISGDVISAPVVDGGRIYFTCFDGTSFCLEAKDGAVVWRKKSGGTSAPLVAGGRLILSLKGRRGDRFEEGLKRLTPDRGDEVDTDLLAADRAAYLARGAGGGVAMAEGETAALDDGVGFATPPAAAKLRAANEHLGVSTVVGAWAYQGARGAVGGGRMMNAQGLAINCLSFIHGRGLWRAEAKGKGITAGMQLFSPPSLGRKNLYLCTAAGHLLSVGQADGAVRFLYATKQPMVLQPALVLALRRRITD
ncbi:MAG: PQQ-binding-like beta-propeller repeat protein, partial [Planctomycetota bacterium]